MCWNKRLRTVGQNRQESRRKYWATRSYVRSFARTAHSWESVLLMSQNDLVLSHSAASGSFPLASLLNLDVPTLYYLLPCLTPNDLLNLELVSQELKVAIQTRHYWKPVFLQYLKQDAVAQRIYRRNIEGHDVNDLTGTLYREQYLEIKEQKERLERNLRNAEYKETFFEQPEEYERPIEQSLVSEGTLFCIFKDQVRDASWKWLYRYE